MSNGQKELLYRRQNKLARKYPGDTGGEFRHHRNTKQMQEFEGTRLPMTGKNRGLDYTPLYRFLQSKVGSVWDEVYSEAISRLDRSDPIFWMVVSDSKPIVRLGWATYYHALFVDEEGILRYVDGSATAQPFCTCCTSTLNGEVLSHYETSNPSLPYFIK